MGKLLKWYDAYQRALPWRESKDPYRIWLSEIMLQQTQVQTVLPYFARFTERFPTVEDLAGAEVEEVLALWSGLGYYRRARWLHRAAIEVSERGGRFPERAAELTNLPGIGPYTAAAIASIAFDEPVAVLDGNVERVLCRLLALAGDPKSPAVRNQLLKAANARLDRGRPGDDNQAMMELGAQVCRPKNPKCEECPLAEDCRALAAGEPERYPSPRQKRRLEKVSWIAALVRDEEERILLFRRPETSSILAGLWELPNVEAQKNRTQAESILAQRYGGNWTLGDSLGAVQHNITFRSIAIRAYQARLNFEGEVCEGIEAAWIRLEELDDYPVSSMVGKVLKVAYLNR